MCWTTAPSATNFSPHFNPNSSGGIPHFCITRSHENTSGIPIEIHRCPCCWAYGDNRNANSSDVEHDAKCTLKSLLSMWTWT